MRTASVVKWGLAAVAAAAVVMAPALIAATTCTETMNSCDVSADDTSSVIQIGGPGSESSNEMCGGFEPCNDPGRLDGGTIAEALLTFSFDRPAGELTITLDNTTATTASLTGIYFNVPTEIVSLTLQGASLSKTCPPLDVPCAVLGTWVAVLDVANLSADGFGRFDAFVGLDGGMPVELLAGQTLTLILDVGGDLSAVTACSFTSEGSKIPPGEKVVTGVGRFQAGGMGDDSGWIGPCHGGDLFVDLKFFRAEPADARVLLAWETGTELDNLGFNVLRKPELGGRWEVVNPQLVPAQGDPLAGADYAFTDTAVVNGVRYIYRLEDIDLQGFNTLHPPDNAVPNPPNPPIKLREPAYGRTFRDAEAITLRWETGVRGPARVQFSADATFPESNRVEFPARGRRVGSSFEMTLNAHERMLAASVMNGAEAGQVYWRVVEAPRGDREPARSDVYRMGREQ
jgi:hypothetical protein